MKVNTLILTAASMITFAGVAAAADGNALFEEKCAKCHGTDGLGETKMGGKLGVKNLTDAKLQGELTDDKIAQTIKEGFKEGDKQKMKPFPDLTADEVKALVARVRAFKK